MQVKHLLGYAIILVLLSSVHVSASVDGTKVWKENGYIKYDVTTSDGTYQLKVTYKQTSGNNMVFNTEISGGGLKPTPHEVTVGKSTGLDSDGNWSGYFTDTSDYEKGRFPTTPSVEGIEGGGQYEITEDTQASYTIQGDQKSIKVWVLYAEESNAHSRLILSQNGGVLLESEISTPQVSQTLKASYIDGVNVQKKFLGFLGAPYLTIFLLSLAPLVFIAKKRRFT